MVLKLTTFFTCIGVVILGHEYIGLTGTLIQILGLGGMLLMVWNYNRKFKE